MRIILFILEFILDFLYNAPTNDFGVQRNINQQSDISNVVLPGRHMPVEQLALS